MEDGVNLLDYAKQKAQEENGDLLSYAKRKAQEDSTKEYVTGKVYQNETPEPTFIDNVSTFLGEMNYYRIDVMKGVATGVVGGAEKLGVPISETLKDFIQPETKAGEIGKGVGETLTGQHSTELLPTAIKGVGKTIINTAKFVTDVTGNTNANKWLDDLSKDLDVAVPSNTIYEKIGETTGQIGAGLFLTKKLPDTKLGRVEQAFLIDFLGFEGDTQNIFNLFDEYGIDLNGISDALKSDKGSTDIANRLKNGFSAVIPTVAVDYLVDALRYSNNIVKQSGKDLNSMSPEEVIKEHHTVLKSEADNVRPKDEMEEVATEPKVPTKQTEQVGTEVTAKVTAKKPELPEGFTYNSAVLKAVELLDEVPVTTNPKKPLNTTKLAPDNQDLFSKATEDITASVDFRSNKKILSDVTKQLKEDLGIPSYDAINDMLNVVEDVTGLTDKVAKSQVITASLFKDFELLNSVAKKEMSASSILDSAEAYVKLLEVSKAMKDTGYNVARSLNILNNVPKDSKVFNSLKVLDSLDKDFGIATLREALDNKDVKFVKEYMDKVDDELTTVVDHIQKAGQDTTFKKFGNVLSELQIGNLLTSPMTAYINVLGGFYMKHHSLLVDTLQFVSGKVFSHPEAMKLRTLKNIYRTAMYNNKEDFKATVGLLRAWQKGKFKDEAYDEMVHIRYNQDQEFSRKFVSAPYIRGEVKGERDEVINSFLNILGIQTRSVHKVLGAWDNYYKLGFFRTELSREAGILADKLKIPDDKFVEFVDRFEKANMELHLMRNHEMTPTKQWFKDNARYIGSKGNELRYADQARDYANKQTFQKELEGIVGDGVKLLNSDGYLRTIIPFKTTPINILYEAVDESIGGIRDLFRGEIKAGGLRADKARARLFMSGSILSYLGYEIATGQITGYFKDEERKVNEGLGIKEYSFKWGNEWVSYQQIEPISTILGVMTGMNRVVTEAWSKPHDTDYESVVKDATQVMKELYLVVAHNILDKSYAKGLSDLVELFDSKGKINRYDYAGNIIGNTIPFSGATTYIQREFGDGYVNETSGFFEKVIKRYDFILNRDGVDIFGEKRKDISYMPYTPLKVSPYLVDNPKNAGAKELSRLGVEVKEVPREFQQSMGDLTTVKIKLTDDEYVALRELKSTKYHFKDTLNKVVNSETYKGLSDQEKKIALSKVVSQVQGALIKEMYNIPSVMEKLPKEINKSIDEFKRVKDSPTWNDMILGGDK